VTRGDWLTGSEVGCLLPVGPHVSPMTRPIIAATSPEMAAPVAPPPPYDPDWLNSLNDAQRQSPEIKEFWRRMHELGGEHVTWLIWSYQPKELWTPDLGPLRQGSMFFLDCGRGPFAVTAAHVYKQYLEDNQNKRVRGPQLANMAFNLPDRLIAWGEDLGVDIATFRITPAEIAAIGKRSVRGTDGPWPPPPKERGAVYFGGFPGGERDHIVGKDFTFGLHSAIVPLTSFTDYQLCCHFDRQYWVDVRGLGLPPVGYDLGGVSGGPMLQPIFTAGVWDWQLAGVISEAVMADFERITAVRAHFILPDGRLSR
jgi:hypothetical protein